MKVLALDVAGEATGWAVGLDRTLHKYGKYISNTRKDKGERLYEFSKFIEELLRTYQPDVVLIEKPYLGRNSNVLVNLSKFVAMVELKAFEVLGLNIEPEWFLDPKTIKRVLGIARAKTKRGYYSNKQAAVVKINSLFGLRLKYDQHKTKRHNDDDIADAIGVWAAWCKLQEKNT